MSAVVLRCANCGTTQSSQGECEACHDGQVRYYCTNHTPGRWLDGQVCSQCRAVYGRTGPRVASPRPSRPAPAIRPAARRGMSESTPPTASSRVALGPWEGRRSPPAPPREGGYVSDEIAARAKAFERLHELLRGAYARERTPPDMDMPSYSAAPPIAGGCLRFVLLIVLFLMLSFFGLSILGSWLMFSF